MRKVTISRMSERYAQTVLTFRITYVCLSSCSATDLLGPRPPHCWACEITYRHTTLGRSLSDKGLDLLWLTTHNIHKRLTSIPLAGFEASVRANNRPQTCPLDRVATGTGIQIYGPTKLNNLLWMRIRISGRSLQQSCGCLVSTLLLQQ